MIKRFLFTSVGLTIAIFLVTCTYTWKGVPTGVPENHMCDPLGPFPQMVQIPLFKNAWQTVSHCDRFNREKVGISLMIFYNAWQLRFGDPDKKILNMLDSVMIEWSDEHKTVTGYSIDGIKFVNSPIVGLARTKSWVWAHTREGVRICETSLVHELVHIAIWNIKGTDGDPDHLGKKYSGWTPDHSMLIQETNATLCGLGL